jgi:hypothetical protein
MIKKLSKAQTEKLMRYYKDGVRTADQLSMGQREVIEEMRIYENMDTDIDRQLQYFKEHGY